MRPHLNATMLVALALIAACHARESVGVRGELPVPNASLAYVIAGHGADTVIVLHGGPGLHSGYLRAAFDTLAREHTIIYYDQRGLGRSAAHADTTQFTIAQEIADLDSLRRALHIGRATLIAHHFGAVIAALYTKRFPAHVRRLVLVAPSFPSSPYYFWASTEPHDVQANARFFKALASGTDSTDPRGFCRHFWNFLFSPIELTVAPDVERLSGDVCDAPPEALRRAWPINRLVNRSLHGFDLRDTLRTLALPALVISGAVDTATQAATAAWVRDLPGAREVRLSVPGLFPWLDARAPFIAAVTAFLQDSAGTARQVAAAAR